MTAARTFTLPPLDTAQQVAEAMWDRPVDQVWSELVARHGYAHAAHLRNLATVLLERHAPRTRWVVTRAGVDHDPVPGQPACVCGLALAVVPAPSDPNLRQGVPCGVCFPPAS